jgi:hypothetical protein
MKYTDKTKMPFGKYKGTPLVKVPASYLLWFHDQDWALQYKPLYNYVQANLKAIIQEKCEADERRKHIRGWADYDIHDDWGDRDEF